MPSRKLLTFILCLITGPALAGYMTLLGAGLGAVQLLAQANFTQSYASSLADLNAIGFETATGLATQFDSTGKLTYRPNNLLTQSNTFNTGWSLGSVTLSSGVSDPIGGSNAWTATATGAGAQVTQSASVGSGNFITAYWVRRRTGSGTISIYSPNAVTPNDISVTGSWQQFYVVGASSGTAYAKIVISNSGDAIDIYAATLSAVTYETTPRTADQVITTSAAYYGPRFDYTAAGVALGLINEPIAATNRALQNRDLTNAAWTKTNITAAKTQTGIDGVANSASLITASAGNGTVLQTVTLASSQRFQSAYVKRVTGSGVVNMTTDGGATWTAITVTGSYTRVSIPAQTVTNPSFGFQIVTNGDAIAVDFVQNETGSEWSSPIAVGAAAVTRAAETLTFSGYASNPFAILSAPESTGSYACNKYADQATANAAIAAANQWIKSVKIWPVGTPLAQQGC